MSSPKTQIHECLTSMILFLQLFKTFQIGQLIRICQLLDQQPTLYTDKTFSRMLIKFIFHINQQNKKKQIDNQYYSLLITQSLIYNLYCHNNKNVHNNSLYSNSLMVSSNSHIAQNDLSSHSIKFYQNGDQYHNYFVNFLMDFVSEEELRKKIKQMIDRQARRAGDHDNQNQRYADVLLQTIQYILNKQGKLDKNGDFQHLKQIIASKNTAINSHFEKKNLKVIIAEVNKIIFSSKLNRIVFLLQQADDRVYLSLLRIYYAQTTDQQGLKGKLLKYFTSTKYTGQQMLLNLCLAYIQSIPSKANLFQSSKNPLFRLIQSQLLFLYMPVFRFFHQIVNKCCKYDFSQSLQFYKACQATINKDLFQFIQMLPLELVDYLREIYHIIINWQNKTNKKQSNQNTSALALTAIKKLLVYSLLGRTILIQTYYSQGIVLKKYEEVCNYIINLFFKSSLRKYQNQSSQYELISTLTKSISNLVDQKISISFRQEGPDLLELQKTLGFRSYVLEEPILNHDYEVLWDVIKNIQFTPKDLKQFEMYKKSEIFDNKIDYVGNLNQLHSLNNTHMIGTPFLNVITPNDHFLSSMQRNKKDSIQNESLDIFQNTILDFIPNNEEIDFLTWMTIGGNRNYQAKAQTNRISSTKKLKQLKEITTFSKAKIKQISSLYQKYQRLMS